jgi:SulP family sulfate permease
MILAVPLRKRLPLPLVGIVAGSFAYHLLVHLRPDVRIGALTGSFEAAVPAPLMLGRFLSLADGSRLAAALTFLFVPAIILALLASMESLISAMAADRHSDHRHDSKKELLGQGVGNMVSACFGGITGAGSVPRTMASYEAGGRTRLAGLFSSALLLAAAPLLGPLLGRIPLVVVAAVLAAVGAGLFDSWTLGLVRKLTKDSWKRREIVGNLAISLFVTVVTVSVGLVFAVALGFVVASALFIAKMGKTVVRRKFRAERIRSKIKRPLHDLRLLEREGGRILVFELQGPIFFGSADTLAREVEETAGDATFIILDLRNVSEIDSTGANILRQIGRRLVRDGKILLLSRADESYPLRKVLDDLDVIDEIGEEFIFPDTDGALEWCEEQILSESGERAESGGRLTPGEIPLFREFREEEREEIGRRMVLRTFRAGEKVIGEGDRDRDLLILTAGTVSVTTRLKESQRRKRLVTYSPGVIVGEIAFLDGSPRSADVRADEDAEMLSMSIESFEDLRKENPMLATKLMVSIARELSQRLRVTSNEVRDLEEL